MTCIVRAVLRPSDPVTVTLNANVPATLGIPLRTPPDDKLIPGGSAGTPALHDQLYGAVPPATCNCVEG